MNLFKTLYLVILFTIYHSTFNIQNVFAQQKEYILEEALVFFDNKNFEKALLKFDEYIQKDSTNALAYKKRGLCFYAKSAFDNALKNYDKSLKLLPSQADVYYCKAIIYFYTGKNKEAEECANKAIHLQTNYPDAKILLGSMETNKPNHEKAWFWYNEAVKDNPIYAAAYYNRGIGYWNMGESPKAYEDFKTALQYNPNEIDAHIAIADLSLKENESKDTPKNKEIRYKIALEHLEKALKINPNSFEVHFIWGNYHKQKKDIKQACAFWQKASDLGSVDAEKFLKKYCKKGKG